MQYFKSIGIFSIMLVAMTGVVSANEPVLTSETPTVIDNVSSESKETPSPLPAASSDTAAVAPAPSPLPQKFAVVDSNAAQIPIVAENSVAQPQKQTEETLPKKNISEPARSSKEKKPSNKFHFGVLAALTYNDFWGSSLGLDDLNESSKEYDVNVSGQDDLTGNYWGLGGNIGLSALYMLMDNVGLHADVVLAYRRGTGKSDVDVVLEWKDSSKKKEKDHLQIDYSFEQLNVDVPLMVRMLFNKNLFVELGPMMSFNFYSSEESTVEDDYSKKQYSNDDVCKSFETDAVLGVGFMRKLDRKLIEMSLRFVLGLTPLSDAEDSPKNWQGQFVVTLWFN